MSRSRATSRPVTIVDVVSRLVRASIASKFSTPGNLHTRLATRHTARLQVEIISYYLYFELVRYSIQRLAVSEARALHPGSTTSGLRHLPEAPARPDASSTCSV